MSGPQTPTLKVLALTAHPVQSPGPRYRVIQFIEPLRAHGIEVDLQSFTRPERYRYLFAPGHRAQKIRWLVEGTLRRAATLARARKYDVILVQVWLSPLRFPPFELALDALGVPVVHDIDDAYYLPTGRPLDKLRGEAWIANITRRAHAVVAGSEFIATFCRQHCPRVHVMPTAVDTDRFTPRDLDANPNPLPVIGWVGTHSTFPFVQKLFGVFEDLAKTHEFVLRIVGAGEDVKIPGVQVENLEWTLEHEVDYFANLDIGLYPLFESTPAKAKHGFKLQQYMSVGVPAVVSDIGANSSLVHHGDNAFLAKDLDDWKRLLAQLIEDEALRRRVGAQARASMDRDVSLRVAAERYAGILRDAAASRR